MLIYWFEIPPHEIYRRNEVLSLFNSRFFLFLVVGATGQVGRSLLIEVVGLGGVLAAARTEEASGFEHADLADPSTLVQLGRRVKPQVIINALLTRRSTATLD